MRSLDVLVTLALVGGGIAAYHHLVAPGGGSRALEDDVLDLAHGAEEHEKRIASLEYAARPSGRTRDAGSLEARVAALEGRLRAGAPEAGAVRAPWSDGDIETLRSLLDEVAQRKRVEVQRRQVEEVLARQVPDLEGTAQREVVDRIVAFLRDAAEQQTRIAEARNPEEVRAAQARMADLKKGLASDLARSEPSRAERIAKALPWLQTNGDAFRGGAPAPPGK